MAANVISFTPQNSNFVTITATSATMVLPAGSGPQIFVQNVGAAVTWVILGTAAAAAVVSTAAGTSSSFPIAPNTSVTLSIDPNNTLITNIAGIGTTGNTLYVSRGNGTPR